MLLPPPVLLLFPPKVERRVLLRPLVDLFVAPVPGLLGLPWLLPKERLLFFFFLVFVVVVVVFLSERESEGVEKADDFFRLLLLFKKTTRARRLGEVESASPSTRVHALPEACALPRRKDALRL